MSDGYLPWRYSPGQVIRYSFNADHAELGRLGFDGTSRMDLPDVRRCFDAWERVCNVRFQEVDGPADVWLYADPVDGWRGTLAYAWTVDANGNGLMESGEQAGIAIDPADTAFWVQSLTHEVGHILGLDHVEGVNSIMAPLSGTAATYVTEYDAGMVRSIYGAPIGIPTITGSNDAETLIGSSQGDLIVAGRGDDRVLGLSGGDVLYGNQGKDHLNGAYGSDRLYGGQDADTLLGGGGDDVLYGNLGADVLSGGDGVDTLYGGQGADILFGDADDVLFGNLGPDVFVTIHPETVADFDAGQGDVIVPLLGQRAADHEEWFGA